MYVPQHFSQPNPEALHDLIRAHPLATLVTNGTEGLNANHIPVLLNLESGTSEPGTLRAHVAITNPLLKQTADGSEALVIFQGPNLYITPSWYDTRRDDEVVPTWNFVAVHVKGTMRFVKDELWLRRHLQELVSHSEAQFEQQWKLSDAPSQYFDSLLNGIVGIEIAIESMQGKWKVSQNQPEYNREGVVKGLTERGNEIDITMAKLIHENPPLRR